MSERKDWLGGGSFATSLVFVFPLLLAYEVGVLFSDRVNGVDFMTRALVSLVDGDPIKYLLVHAALMVTYLAALLVLRSQRRIDFGAFLPMLIESSIYALTLGTLIVFVMQSMMGLSGALSVGESLKLGGAGSAVVTSLGAGVHEELVFRLLLFGGGMLLLQRLGTRRSIAILVALAVSSVLFSLAHHAGPQGETFRAGVFTYRLLAGVFFGLIYYYRSFAHAVYAHFLYDVYVLLLRS